MQKSGGHNKLNKTPPRVVGRGIHKKRRMIMRAIKKKLKDGKKGKRAQLSKMLRLYREGTWGGSGVESGNRRVISNTRGKSQIGKLPGGH